MNMILKCPVLRSNEALAVILFGDAEVQIPPIDKDLKLVNVMYKDGRYSIVDDHIEEEPKIIEKPQDTSRKKNVKKTINEVKDETHDHN